MTQFFLSVMCLLVLSVFGFADDAKSRVDQVITAAGGEAQLLTLFRYRERVLVSGIGAAPIAPDEPGNRTSVVQVGGDVWLGTTKRGKDKVRVLIWAWSLRLLQDPKAKVESIPDIMIAEKSLFGLRVTEAISDPIDLYFDSETKRLVAIDYTDTRHIFSDWRVTADDRHYPAHVKGYRFIDPVAKTVQELQWYQTDILELTPLAELPAELK